MAMTHRERVLAALDHREPDRVPIDFGGYPGATSINIRAYEKLKKYLNIDVNKEIMIGSVTMFTADIDDRILDRFGIDTQYAMPSMRLSTFNNPETFQDKWKVTWQKTGASTYAPVKGPFYKEKGTLAELKNFEWPQPGEMVDIKQLKAKVARLRQKSDRALIAKLPMGIVTLAQILRGLEDWLTDLYVNRDFCEALLDRCSYLWMDAAKPIVEAIGDQVDIFVWGDDYGFQNGPMLSPEMFREIVRFRNKRMLDLVKTKSNAKILLHCCGSVYLYLEDFVQMGIDALNPIQVSAKDMDAVRIKEEFGDQLTLWGAVGIDDLIKEPPKKVKEMVKRRIDELGKGGGYVLSATHNLLTDVPVENIVAMFEGAAECGRY